jgi:hypothetical protein
MKNMDIIISISECCPIEPSLKINYCLFTLLDKSTSMLAVPSFIFTGKHQRFPSGHSSFPISVEI